MPDTKKYSLVRTGKIVPFKSVDIGNPFFAHDRVWIRTGREAGTELHGTGERSSSCNFTTDPEDENVESMMYIVE